MWKNRRGTNVRDEEPAEGDEVVVLLRELERAVARVPACGDVRPRTPDLAEEVVRLPRTKRRQQRSQGARGQGTTYLSRLRLAVYEPAHARLHDVEVRKVGVPLRDLRDEVGELRLQVRHAHICHPMPISLFIALRVGRRDMTHPGRRPTGSAGAQSCARRWRRQRCR